MHEILDNPDPNIVGIELSGTLTEDDHDAIASILKHTMEAHTTTRALFALEDVDGWEPEALWEDLAFDIRHVRTLDKVAIAGDDVWSPWRDKVEALFPPSQIRTFDADERDEAWDWIRGDMNVPGIGPGSVPEPEADAQHDTDED
ncbi:MAG: STAS/SEC14 domain-containing protein [Salinibacter sp.]